MCLSRRLYAHARASQVFVGVWGLGEIPCRLAKAAKAQGQDRFDSALQELAEKLISLAPDTLQGGKVFFGMSGSDANDTQLCLRLLERRSAESRRSTRCRRWPCLAEAQAPRQVRLLWHYNTVRGLPQKRKIIGRVHGYHGVALATRKHVRHCNG